MVFEIFLASYAYPCLKGWPSSFAEELELSPFVGSVVLSLKFAELTLSSFPQTIYVIKQK